MIEKRIIVRGNASPKTAMGGMRKGRQLSQDNILPSKYMYLMKHIDNLMEDTRNVSLKGNGKGKDHFV